MSGFLCLVLIPNGEKWKNIYIDKGMQLTEVTAMDVGLLLLVSDIGTTETRETLEEIHAYM